MIGEESNNQLPVVYRMLTEIKNRESNIARQIKSFVKLE